MTDLVNCDQGARRVFSGSRKAFLFALWAIAMRCYNFAR